MFSEPPSVVTFPADPVENSSESMLPDRLFEKCGIIWNFVGKWNYTGGDGCSFLSLLLPPEKQLLGWTLYSKVTWRWDKNLSVNCHTRIQSPAGTTCADARQPWTRKFKQQAVKRTGTWEDGLGPKLMLKIFPLRLHWTHSVSVKSYLVRLVSTAHKPGAMDTFTRGGSGVNCLRRGWC